MKDFLAMSPIASAILDSEGKILYCNEVFKELIGDKLEGCSKLEEIIDNKEVLNTALKSLDSGDKDKKRFEINITDEKPQTFRALVKLIDKEFRGSEEKYLLNLLDLKEQKTLEMKLNHSQKMQAVGQLAGGIAHDFNNLLTAMSGFCDLLLQKHPPGDRSFPDIMQIKQNVNRAANLVRQLLAFSRKQVLKPKIVDITDSLSELSNLLRRLLGDNIKLQMQHGRDLGKILADPGQIDQVTINLAVNSRDAMPHGGTLTIETANFSVNEALEIPADLYSPDTEERIIPGDYVVVKIRDTGTGMSREVLEQIFEPFYSTKEIGAGTGLGLATVYGIVKQSGGYILVKSKEGEGTEFQIYLKSVDPADYAENEPVKERKSLGADLTGEGTILLVEDEVPVRIFASRALSNKGYKVLEADNAEAALDVLDKYEGDVDLIISDVIMPGMNGPEMVKEIKQTYPDLKVIFISGYTQDAFADFADNAEELNFLPKPFTLKDLATAVKEVMSK